MNRGTEENPIEIEEKEDISLLGKYPNSYFVLTSDIDVEGEIISNRSEHGGICSLFEGVLDGQGHKISNFQLESEEIERVGFIEKTIGVIKNLKLVEFEISGKREVGSVAGVNKGIIENCQIVNGDIRGDKDVGGIVGVNEGFSEISDCYFEGSVKAESVVGGVSGKSIGLIKGCEICEDGKIISKRKQVGGIVGINNYLVKDCYFFGKFEPDNLYKVGYLVGSNNADVKDCFFYSGKDSFNKGIGENRKNGRVNNINGDNDIKRLRKSIIANRI